MLKRSILLVVVLIAVLLIANPMNAEKNEIVFGSSLESVGGINS